MQTKSLEEASRNFNPMAIPSLSNKAREAVNAAFEAMSTWRNETAEASEKNSKKVIDKMAAAATALGWPEQVVDAARTQMQTISEMQIKAMDHMKDAWEEQLKLPDAATTPPSAMLSKLKSMPGFGQASSWPGAAAQGAAMNPMQLWINFVEQWQKSCTETMTFWSNVAKARNANDQGRHQS
jgi:hypothetical protein